MELRDKLVLRLLKVDVGDTSKYRSPVESKSRLELPFFRVEEAEEPDEADPSVFC
jgi:hypothetical protein